MCANQGFVAEVGGTTYEGFYPGTPLPAAPRNVAWVSYIEDEQTATATVDTSSMPPVFDISFAADSSAAIPQLGDGSFALVRDDRAVAADAATRCRGLELRTWWSPDGWLGT